MKICFICNETEGVSEWNHPVDGRGYHFCGYCLKTIVGVCAECNGILSRLDPIGVNNEGQRICYKCSSAHDMEEDS